MTGPSVEPDDIRDHPRALWYACPYCHAAPGQPCNSPETGKPHYSRLPPPLYVDDQDQHLEMPS